MPEQTTRLHRNLRYRLAAVLLSVVGCHAVFGQQDRALAVWKDERSSESVAAALEEVETGGVVRPLSIATLRSEFGADATFFKYDPDSASTVDISQATDVSLASGQFITIADRQLGLAAITDRQGRRFEPLDALFLARDLNGAPRAYRMDQHSDGFVWNRDVGLFQADLFLRASDANDPGATDELASPILVRVTGRDLLDDPYEAVITRLGFSGEQHVEMRSRASNDPIPVSLRSPIVPNLLKTVEIEVSKPRLRLTANPPAIPAFGLSSTQIIVDSAGELPERFPLFHMAE